MGHRSDESNANSEFSFDPTDKVVGVIDDAGDAVAAKKTEARGRAREVLKSHRGHFINFHGRRSVQQLEP